MSEERCFKVLVTLDVMADSEDQAIKVVSDRLSESGPSRIFPVATFNATPTANPIRSHHA